MRLNGYIRNIMNEKVSKLETSEVLKTGDVLVGGEFEFKVHEFQDKYGGGKSYDDIYKMWEKHVGVLESWLDDISDIEDDTNAEVKRLDKEKWAAESKIDDLDIDEDKDKIEDLRDMISDIDDEIEAIEMKKWEKMPMQPSMPNDLVDYYDNMSIPYNDEIDIIDVIDKIDRYNGRSSIINYIAPEPLEAELDVIDWIEEFMELNKKDFPGKKFETGSYGDVEQRVGSDLWAAEEDGSLKSEGMEIKSPPMPLKDFIPIMGKMFNWIKKHDGYADSDCGFHIHMSLKSKLLKNKLDFVKLMLFTDEEGVMKFLDNRHLNSTYLKSIKERLSYGVLEYGDLDELIYTDKLEKKFNTEHTDSINIRNAKRGHVEFRHLGGSDYLDKEKNITKAIADFAFNLLLAFSPEFKKKEYVTKVSRIINKVEKKKKEYFIHSLDNLFLSKLSFSGGGQKVEKYLKSLRKNINNIDLPTTLEMYRKLNKFSKDVSLINAIMSHLYGTAWKTIL